jgi:tetratricopeptide (TPR) repeat protein
VLQIQKLLGLTESVAVEDSIVHSVSFGVKRWLLEEMMHDSPVSFISRIGTSRSVSSADHSNSFYSARTESEDRSYMSSSASESFDAVESYLTYCIEEELEVFSVGKELSQQSGSAVESIYIADESQLTSFLQSLGELYIVQQRFEEAESVFLRVLKLQQQELGPCNLSTLATTLRVADVFAMSKKTTMAELFYSSYLKGMEESVVVSTRQLLIAKQHVGNFFYAQGDFGKAETLHMACYQQAQAHYGPYHHVSLHATSMLATIKQRARKFEEALELAKESVAVAKRLYPSDGFVVEQYEMLLESIQALDSQLDQVNSKSPRSGNNSSLRYAFKAIQVSPVQDEDSCLFPSANFYADVVDLDSCLVVKEKPQAKRRHKQRVSDSKASVACIIA